MNLAELFEKTIKGAIALVYGTVYCLGMIARKPRTGAIVIWAHWRRDTSANIGPQTFQFVSCFLLALLIVWNSGSLDLGGSLFRYTAVGIKGDETELVRVTLCAIAIYVLVDVIALLSSHIERPQCRLKVRSAIIDIFRYFISGASLLAVTPWLVCTALGWRFPLDASNVTKVIGAHRWTFIIISFAVLSALVAFMFRNGWRHAMTKLRRHRPPKIATRALLLSLPVASFYLTVHAPFYYFMLRPDEWMRDSLASVLRPPKLSVSYLRCDLSAGGKVTVTALLSNSADSEFVVNLRSLGLMFAQGPMAGYYDMRYFRVRDQPPTILNPPDSSNKPLQVLAGHTSLPLTFVYNELPDFEKLKGYYLEWQDKAKRAQGYESYFVFPSCFLTYDAIFPENDITISVPAGHSDNIFAGLGYSRAGEVTWTQQ